LFGKDKVDETSTALVTGASSGIGLELARVLARHGHHLVLVARDEIKLNEIAKDLGKENNVTVKIIAKDLSNQSAPTEIYDLLHNESVSVDVLVNCAGTATLGLFADVDLASQMKMIQVNVLALTALTHLFLKDMLTRGRGKILNVASTAAFQPGPLMAVYYATKAYVLSFSEAIANEVSASGVSVTALCPGPTKTAFQVKMGTDKTRLFHNRMLDILPAETVAKIGYSGLIGNRTVVIPGFKNRLTVVLVRLLPRQWVTKVTRRMQEQA
jgi:short-subunit dehydrogenase